jgi:hypothetical protein
MKHECGLCLRDNKICKIRNSFFDILFGRVTDCYLFNDYHKGLLKEKVKKK